MSTKPMWKLEGYDTFDGGYYPLQGEYATKDAAEAAAEERLKVLEATQPTLTSGGQDGIQDQVYILSPDGTSQRYFAKPKQITNFPSPNSANS